MEVKIKQGYGMIEATIEMVDGVMVVSPKEEKFEPKDGDVFCVDSFYPLVGIVKEVYSYGKPDKDRLYFSVGYWKQSGNMQFGIFCACNRNTEPNYRPATEEERQKLFDKLNEEGYEWDVKMKKLIKSKVKPVEGSFYYKPTYTSGRFEPCHFRWLGCNVDKIYLDKGLVKEKWCECNVICDKFNKAIESVKP